MDFNYAVIVIRLMTYVGICILIICFDYFLIIVMIADSRGTVAQTCNLNAAGYGFDSHSIK